MLPVVSKTGEGKPVCTNIPTFGSATSNCRKAISSVLIGVNLWEKKVQIGQRISGPLCLEEIFEGSTL